MASLTSSGLVPSDVEGTVNRVATATVPEGTAASGAAGARPLVIEVIGPAGAGKSSVIREICASEPTIRRGRSLRGGDIPLIIRRAPRWLPATARLALTDPTRARQFARHVVRVDAMDGVLPARPAPDTTAVLLDEGPVFSMALMLAFGGSAGTSGVVARQVARALTRWASVLDAVVWLDADDDVLTSRIRAREKAHRIKDASPEVAHAFLRRYRDAYDVVGSGLADSGKVRVHRIDTATTSVSRAASDIVGLIAGLRHVH